MIFSKKIINHKPVYLVEEHHQVLIPWALERANLPQPPQVLTLDHHTDTLPAFTHYDETHPEPHPKHYGTAAVRGLEKNCGTASMMNIFSSGGTLIARRIFPSQTFHATSNRAEIRHDPPPSQKPDVLADYYAMALEDDFLRTNQEKLSRRITRPYILDIDLDYFKGEKSIAPKSFSIFTELIRQSAVITIARERDWVRLLNMDYGNFHYDYFEALLLKRIEED